LRKKIFADNLKFSSLKAAEEFDERELEKINAKSEIELEKAALLSYKPPNKLAEICEIFDKPNFVGKNVDALDIPKPLSDIDIASNIAMTNYNSLVIGGVRSAS
jgi:hypothetical protein